MRVLASDTTGALVVADGARESGIVAAASTDGANQQVLIFAHTGLQ